MVKKKIERKYGSLLILFICAAIFSALHILPEIGMPGPFLYLEKEGVVHKMGEKNFRKMAFYLAPSAIASFCSKKDKSALSPQVKHAVHAFNTKYQNAMKNFLQHQKLNSDDRDILDEYLYIYFKGIVNRQPNVCVKLSSLVTTETFPY